MTKGIWPWKTHGIYSLNEINVELVESVFQPLWDLIQENIFESFIGLSILIFVLYQWFFSSLAIAKRQFKKDAVKPIFNFKEGEFGKIIGKVENISTPLTAPLSGKKCVYYEVIVIRNPGEDEIKLVEEKKSIDFFISNNSGKALVKINNTAICEINKDINFSSGWITDPNNSMKAFLEKHAIKQKGFLNLNKSLDFIEKRFDIGEQIGILGVGHWEIPTNTNNNQENNKKVLTFKSLEQHPLFVSDNPKTLENKSVL